MISLEQFITLSYFCHFLLPFFFFFIITYLKFSRSQYHHFLWSSISLFTSFHTLSLDLHIKNFNRSPICSQFNSEKNSAIRSREIKNK